MVYEKFDDINLICDSYEANERIREPDKYCIDERTLKDKVENCFRIIAIIRGLKYKE